MFSRWPRTHHAINLLSSGVQAMGPTGGPGTEVVMGTAAKWESAEALDQRLAANTERLIARLFAVGGAGTRERFVSNAGIELIVNHVSYGKVAVEDVLAGRCAAEELTATQDGRHYDRRGWCQCGGGEGVYVERWTRDGVAFHGWVCGDCRRLVQAG